MYLHTCPNVGLLWHLYMTCMHVYCDMILYRWCYNIVCFHHHSVCSSSCCIINIPHTSIIHYVKLYLCRTTSLSNGAVLYLSTVRHSRVLTDSTVLLNHHRRNCSSVIIDCTIGLIWHIRYDKQQSQASTYSKKKESFIHYSPASTTF